MKKNKLIILGAGGHAKVIIDILKDSNIYDIIGCLDISFPGKEISGVQVIGDDSKLPQLLSDGIRHAFVAVGDNRLRDKLSHQVTKLGFELINAISVHSVISPSTRLGHGIAIMPGAVINVDAQLGDNVIINTGAGVDHDCILAEGCHIAPGCFLAGNVVVGKGAFLGIGCKVIPKIKVGEWSVVGAGAAVIKDLPPYSLAVGVPARVIKIIEGQKA
jgi:UDP-perosamine 4-acetyltransferase